MANVYTSLSNAIWYTDKCSISTGSTAVTYQVYATALGDAPAAGNIYSGPPEIGANEIKQIYVGVGNYITVSGSNYTAQEIGGQTSAQAGTGPFTENLTPPTPEPIYTITSQPGAINSGSSGTFDVTTTDVADGTTLYWTINNITSIDADFVAVSGSFVIASNAGVFDVTTVSGITSDETFTASIRTGSIAGTVVDTSDSVTINLDPATASGSMLIPNTSSRVTLSPGIIVGGTTTTPFTAEGWFYSTVNPGTNSGPVLLSTDTGSGTPAYYKALTVNIVSNTQVVVDSNGAAATTFDFAETMLVNTWYYVAVTRDTGGYIQVWMGKDGDATATASTTGRFATSGNAAWDLTGLSNTIGAFVPANRYTTGYISNLRVDSSSLYATTAATIPVPTASFAEIAGTVFLQNDATLTDQTGNQTLTAAGSAAGNALNPF